MVEDTRDVRGRFGAPGRGMACSPADYEGPDDVVLCHGQDQGRLRGRREKEQEGERESQGHIWITVGC